MQINRIALIALSFAVHLAAAQTSNTPVRPPSPVIVELEQSLLQKPDDALLMGRLAAEYHKAGRWKDGYQLAMKRLAATPQDPAALYDAGAAAFRMITAGNRELAPKEIGKIAEEGVQNLDKAIARVRDFTSAMIYKSQLHREQAKLVSDPKEIARLQVLAAAAMNDAIQTKRPGAATGLPPGAFAGLPIVFLPRDVRSEDLLPPGTASFLVMPTEVPRQITRIVEEPAVTPGAAPAPPQSSVSTQGRPQGVFPGATAQNSSFSLDGPQVLSPNPSGSDLGPFLNGVINKLRSSWYSVMPEAARKGDKGRVDIVFTIMKDGTVQDLKLVVESGNQTLDQAARDAIQLSRFPPLPADFNGDRIILRMPFLYNIKPGER